MEKKLDRRSKELRREIIEIYDSGRRGHIASALSIVEIVRVLYDAVLLYNPKKPDWPGRDRFILSKGHGCLAQYALLVDKGFVSESHKKTFCAVDGLFGGHPDHHIPGVEWSTGSVGHGLAVAVGMAIAIKYQKSNIKNQISKSNIININKEVKTLKKVPSRPRVFCLLGDGECNEGSIWEAALHAAKYKLANLTVLVDYNQMQSYGKSTDVLPLTPIGDKWKAFGFGVSEVDGHDVLALQEVFRRLPIDLNKPSAVICHTVKGKGIPIAENNPQWHHRRGVTDEEIKMLYETVEGYK
ncbi:transketolase [Candidatus Gottesmanbacteria bacterium RBG_16_43_7]|uniref:Transketolase n=1 Tax=Candidatus Gottesmanbacteria bacterium RBG_16_43_7 TaxID=1798373 RepID=A0A1F5ZBX9_9BACT|nr:MAG: transketolase [Candidatus Gottesmanbacteria bacterium RBG_16_43_7]